LFGGCHSSFEIAGGSVTGRSHALAGRGNQDAFAFRADGDQLAAVVCDGCGSGAHSEVGAQLGARVVVTALLRLLGDHGDLTSPALWSALRAEVLAALRPVALAAGPLLGATVSDLLLFTVVGVALRGDRGAVFAAGDGLVVMDGAVTRLGPFPGDAPPYLGYGLLDAAAPGFAVVRAFATAEVTDLLLGTDGAAALAELDGGRHLRALAEDDRHYRNRDAVRRALALLNREEARPDWEARRMVRRRGLLEDDATVVVLRRRPA
jgi:hypothetical protein